MSGARLGNVQFCRALAASAILFSHAADVLIADQDWWRVVPWTAGVDLFFVISGFVMMLVAGDGFGRQDAPRTFLIRRINRIVPAYWALTLAFAAALLIAPGLARNSEATATIVATSLLFVPWPRGDGMINPLLSQGWTLNYEAFFYATFALALLHRRGAVLLALAFIALVAVGPLIPEDWFVAHFYADPIILEFLGGMGLAALYRRGVRLGVAGAIGLAVAALGIGALLSGHGLPRVVALGVPSAMLAAAAIFGPQAQPSRPARAGWALGDASYLLYLIHPFVVHLAAATMGKGTTVLVATIALAIALALVGHRWLEAPVTRWLNRRSGQRPTPLESVAP